MLLWQSSKHRVGFTRRHHAARGSARRRRSWERIERTPRTFSRSDEVLDAEERGAAHRDEVRVLDE